MAITPVTCLNYQDNTDKILTNYNMGSLSPLPVLADGPVFAFTVYGDATGVDGTPAITGAGTTWTLVNTGTTTRVNNPNNLSQIHIYKITGVDPTSAAVNGVIGGNSASNIWSVVVQFTGANSTVVQSSSGTIDDASAPFADLDITFGTTPLNSVINPVGHSVAQVGLTSHRAMGAAIELDATDGTSFVMGISRAALNDGFISPKTGETQYVDNGSNESADSMMWYVAGGGTPSGWGVLLA